MLGEGEPGDDVALLAVRPLPAAAEQISLTLPAEPASLAGLRRRLARFLHATGASEAEQYELTLTICEAAGNAIEHAYGPGDATYEVEVTFASGELVATVRDSGSWRDKRGEHRGRGLDIIEQLMDHVDVEARGGRHRGDHAQAARCREGGVSSPAEIAIERRGGSVIAHVSGEIDMTNAAYLREQLLDSMPNDALALVIDIGGCRYLDSAAIEVLFDLSRRLARRRQDLRLVMPAELAAQARDRADRDRNGRAGLRVARLRPLAVGKAARPAAQRCSTRTHRTAREGVGWRTNRRRGSAMWRWLATGAAGRRP